MGETHSSVALVVWSVLRFFVTMNERRRLICLYLLYHRQLRRKCTKYWAHLERMQRVKVGELETLYE
jgi:hypothetical protein